MSRISDPSFGEAVHTYLQKFDHHVVLKLGHTYSQEYREFYAWCQENLGEKYKDWFIVGGGGKNQSTCALHLRNSRWGILLALKFPDLVVHTFDIK